MITYSNSMSTLAIASTHRRRSRPLRATASCSGEVSVRRLAQGNPSTLRGAGDPTRNHSVTSQLALPPQPHAVIKSVPLRTRVSVKTDPQAWYTVSCVFLGDRTNKAFLSGAFSLQNRRPCEIISRGTGRTNRGEAVSQMQRRLGNTVFFVEDVGGSCVDH